MLPKTPAKKILLVSDNPELTLFFKTEIANLPPKQEIQVDYRYSAINTAPQAMIDLGAASINIKDPVAVKDLITKYDLVLSLHCKQIFPKELVENVCCINFHPGFNPYNRGWYPQVFSIINGLPVGATIHLMDTDVDHGPIIDQQMVAVSEGDTSLEVYRKVIEIEKELIHKNLLHIINGSFTTFLPKDEGNYNGIKDHKTLCRLDMAHVGTLKEHINLLRALTHGPFRNACFTGADGKKYFVRLSLEQEP